MNKNAQALLGLEKYGMDELLEIMRLLRGEGGCPWDREQTHESIRENLIEETYEAVEAIDNRDRALLREELGDVLLQVVFHTQMCDEAGEFSFTDVTDELCRKLIVRHPHIFGEIEVGSVGEVLRNWEEIKEQTKHRETKAEALQGVCRALPALMRAKKLAKKAGYVPQDITANDPTKVGRQLFEIAAAARASGIDAESALYAYCEHFVAKQSRGD